MLPRRVMVAPRALLSVFHKDGIVELGQALHNLGWELLSTGGTSRVLREADLPVIDVSDATGHPECFDGRVKTLHPAVHGGILVRRDREDDMEMLDELGYRTVDLVCVKGNDKRAGIVFVELTTDSGILSQVWVLAGFAGLDILEGFEIVAILGRRLLYLLLGDGIWRVLHDLFGQDRPDNKFFV